MKKIILLMIVFAIFTACKKNEEQKFAIDQAKITLRHDEAIQLNASAQCIWSTSDSNVAIVSSSGLVTGVRLGEATIFAQANGEKDECSVEVSPVSKLYEEPFFIYGAAKESIKAKEHRLLQSETIDALLYFGENSNVRNVMYMFQLKALTSSIVLLQNSTQVAQEVATFLEERYVYQGYSGGFYMYANGKGVGMAINIDNDLGLNVVYIYTGEKQGNLVNKFKCSLQDFKKDIRI